MTGETSASGTDIKCERCGRETECRTLDGSALCIVCQDKLEAEETTRELGQSSLDAIGGNR